MRSRWCAMLSAALATGAGAQGLNLGPDPATPRPGEGRAALALAELLEREANEGELTRAGRSLRRLAAALLHDGEHAGREGSEAVLAGLSLAARRHALDGALAAASEADRAAVVAGSAHPGRLDARSIDLALRDALGPLVERLCGWPGADAAPLAAALEARLAALADLPEHRRVHEETRDALAETLAVLAEAPGHRAYLTTALEWATLLAEGAGALGEPPPWVEMDSRDRLRDDFSAGAALVLADPAAARASLGRVAAAWRIVEAAGRLADSAQSRELRDAINSLIQATGAVGEPEAVARIADALLAAEALLAADENLPREASIVRQVRPMIGPLVERHRRAERSLERLLPAMLRQSDPMADPAVLAAMESLRGSASDLGMPERLSDMLAQWPEGIADPRPRPGGEPVPVRAAAPVAEQIRRLAVALGQDGGAEPALEALREIDGVAAMMREMPGEREVRRATPTPAWRLVTGGQTDRLAYVIDQAREAWTRAHSSERFEDDRPGAAAAVRDLARAMATLADGAAFEAARIDWGRRIEPLANALAPVETTREGAEALAADLRQRLGDLATAIARADDGAAAAAMAEEIDRDFSAALLLGRLETLAPEWSIEACAPADELGAGPPPPEALLVEHRASLAEVARWGHEAAAADGEAREKFRRAANAPALPVLRALRNPAR